MVAKEEIIEILKTVNDPEIGIDVVNLGLIYDLKIDKDVIKIKMTMTAPTCPVTPWILSEAQKCVENLADVEAADIELVWEPQWKPEMMSDYAKEQLNMY